MGGSGGGSLTGPRLHRLQEFQEDLKMTAGGAWRRPRMKVYDYNQEFGGNYYQPMIQYINHKDIYGPFSKKADVYLPHSAEVTSAKYTNMRYNDKSSAKHNLDQFLVDAHKTQIKELNGTTAFCDEHEDAPRDPQHRLTPDPHLQAHTRPLHQAGQE